MDKIYAAMRAKRMFVSYPGYRKLSDQLYPWARPSRRYRCARDRFALMRKDWRHDRDTHRNAFLKDV